jgi:hypothetical protein
MKEFIKKIVSSFDNKQNEGFSARKLTAFFSIGMGAYITICKLPADAQLHALYAWQVLCLLCLGIVTFEQIIKLKNDSNSK